MPWSCSTTWRMPIATWREMMRRHYPGRSWVALQEDTVERLTRVPPRARPALLRRLRRAHARARPGGGGPVSDADRDAFETLVRTLLWEGYALYPYTRGTRQERDADAVRDRLPAAPTRPRPRARCDSLALRGLALAGADAVALRRAALPAGRAARGTRRWSAASRSRRGRSPSSRAEPRAAGLRGGRPARCRAPLGRARARSATRSSCAWRTRRRSRRRTRAAPRRSPPACSRRCRSCGSARGASPRRSTRARRCAARTRFPVLATAADDVAARRHDHAARAPADRSREPG